MDILVAYTRIPANGPLIQNFTKFLKNNTYIIGNLLNRIRLNLAFVIVPNTKPFLAINLQQLLQTNGNNKLFSALCANIHYVYQNDQNYWYFFFYVSSNQILTFTDQRMFYLPENADRMQTIIDLPLSSYQALNYSTEVAYYTQSITGEYFALYRVAKRLITPINEKNQLNIIDKYLANLSAQKIRDTVNNVEVFASNNSTKFVYGNWDKWYPISTQIFKRNMSLYSCLQLIFTTTGLSTYFITPVTLNTQNQVDNNIFNNDFNDISILTNQISNEYLINKQDQFVNGLTISSVNNIEMPNLEYLYLLARTKQTSNIPSTTALPFTLPIAFISVTESKEIINTEILGWGTTFVISTNNEQLYQITLIDPRCQKSIPPYEECLNNYNHLTYDDCITQIRFGNDNFLPLRELQIFFYKRVEVYTFDFTREQNIWRLRVDGYTIISNTQMFSGSVNKVSITTEGGDPVVEKDVFDFGAGSIYTEFTNRRSTVANPIPTDLHDIIKNENNVTYDGAKSDMFIYGRYDVINANNYLKYSPQFKPQSTFFDNRYTNITFLPVTVNGNIQSTAGLKTTVFNDGGVVLDLQSNLWTALIEWGIPEDDTLFIFQRDFLETPTGNKNTIWPNTPLATQCDYSNDIYFICLKMLPDGTYSYQNSNSLKGLFFWTLPSFTQGFGRPYQSHVGTTGNQGPGRYRFFFYDNQNPQLRNVQNSTMGFFGVPFGIGTTRLNADNSEMTNTSVWASATCLASMAPQPVSNTTINKEPLSAASSQQFTSSRPLGRASYLPGQVDEVTSCLVKTRYFLGDTNAAKYAYFNVRQGVTQATLPPFENYAIIVNSVLNFVDVQWPQGLIDHPDSGVWTTYVNLIEGQGSRGGFISLNNLQGNIFDKIRTRMNYNPLQSEGPTNYSQPTFKFRSNHFVSKSLQPGMVGFSMLYNTNIDRATLDSGAIEFRENNVSVRLSYTHFLFDEFLNYYNVNNPPANGMRFRILARAVNGQPIVPFSLRYANFFRIAQCKKVQYYPEVIDPYPETDFNVFYFQTRAPLITGPNKDFLFEYLPQVGAGNSTWENVMWDNPVIQEYPFPPSAIEPLVVNGYGYVRADFVLPTYIQNLTIDNAEDILGTYLILEYLYNYTKAPYNMHAYVIPLDDFTFGRAPAYPPRYNIFPVFKTYKISSLGDEAELFNDFATLVSRNYTSVNVTFTIYADQGFTNSGIKSNSLRFRLYTYKEGTVEDPIIVINANLTNFTFGQEKNVVFTDPFNIDQSTNRLFWTVEFDYDISLSPRNNPSASISISNLTFQGFGSVVIPPEPVIKDYAKINYVEYDPDYEYVYEWDISPGQDPINITLNSVDNTIIKNVYIVTVDPNIPGPDEFIEYFEMIDFTNEVWNGDTITLTLPPIDVDIDRQLRVYLHIVSESQTIASPTFYGTQQLVNNPNNSVFNIPTYTPTYLELPLTQERVNFIGQLILDSPQQIEVWIELDLALFFGNRDYIFNQFNEFTAVAYKENDRALVTNTMVLTDCAENYGYNSDYYSLLYNCFDGKENFEWQKFVKKDSCLFLMSAGFLKIKDIDIWDWKLKRYLTVFWR